MISGFDFLIVIIQAHNKNQQWDGSNDKKELFSLQVHFYR